MREKIINKSGELFLTLGFKSVTMDDIANALGISKKTIYQHFSNKTKLVEATTLNVFESICGGIDCICNASNNPIQELYDIKMFVMNYLKNEKTSPQFQLKKYYPKIHQKTMEKEMVLFSECLKKNLEKGIQEGFYRNDLNIDLITKFYFFCISTTYSAFILIREN